MALHGTTSESARTATAGLLPLVAAEIELLPSMYLLRSAAQVIGRDASNAISLPSTSLSRQHARVFREGDGWFIADLESRNGTYLDGVSVSTARLHDGALLRTGDVLFKFVAWGAEGYVSYCTNGTMEPGKRRLAKNPTELLGGAVMDRIVAQLEKIAPTELSIILYGESGTGKEVAAREAHKLSERRGDFIAVNCAAIPQQLLESELFGYRKGAFSGADRDKIGLIKAAHRGTLFLDEIGDMPLEAQAKLLRVLQSREILPVGATTTEPVDVRVLCATHRNLTELQATNAFRGDLLARLQEYTLTLPPLRQRNEDVLLLARAMLRRHSREEVTLSFGFLLGLLHHDWPFNVRELEACLKRAVVLADTPTLHVDQLPEALQAKLLAYQKSTGEPPRTSTQSLAPPHLDSSSEANVAPKKHGQRPSETELRTLLLAHQGNVASVARVLGKERMQIHRWMKRYNIAVQDFRDPDQLPTDET